LREAAGRLATGREAEPAEDLPAETRPLRRFRDAPGFALRTPLEPLAVRLAWPLPFDGVLAWPLPFAWKRLPLDESLPACDPLRLLCPFFAAPGAQCAEDPRRAVPLEREALPRMSRWPVELCPGFRLWERDG
jgi:hypothetical protein